VRLLVGPLSIQRVRISSERERLQVPVKVWTGLPGAGKTAVMVDEILKFKAAHPDRPIFAININGLADGVAENLTMEQLHQWWELPPGSLICIDECQEDEFFPLDHGKPPEWVKRISKVRHEGMDFWMTTQHPTMISSYVRKLIDQHVHCVRKFNTNVVQRYTWGRCMDACEKGGAQKVAASSVGTLPTHVFHSYKSSNAHNMKRRIPFKAYMVILAFVVVAGALVATWYAYGNMKKTTSTAAGGKVVDHDETKAVEAKDLKLRTTDYIKWTEPRVPGMPWTAPAYDTLSVKVNPRVFCIAWEDGHTNCITEQGTKLNVPDKVARLIARDGVYDPFLPDQADQIAKEKKSATTQPAIRDADRPPIEDQSGLSSIARDSGLHASYLAPSYQQPLGATSGYVGPKSL
jgi:zona occludens toxin